MIIHGLFNVSMHHQPDIRKYGRNEIVGLENVFYEGNHFTTAVAENPSTVYKVPIEFFKGLAQKYLELESKCKIEEIFFRIKALKHHGANLKSEFFQQLMRIKSIILNGILKNALIVKMEK